MLDRTKLSKVGRKHERRITDDEYAKLLISKCILLGAKWRAGDGTDLTVVNRLVVPLRPPHEWVVNSGTLFGVPIRWVIAKSPHQQRWRVNTKMMHDFLAWHAGGKYEQDDA